MRDYLSSCLVAVLLMSGGLLHAQEGKAILEGYVFEDNNSGYLNEVKVTVLDAETSLLYGEVQTNREGYFAMEVPVDRDFTIRATKGAFVPAEGVASSKTLILGKTFAKIPMARAPGYRLEVTLAAEREEEQEEVDAVSGSLIEVYNNTEGEEVLVLQNHPSPYFSFQLEQGNHYTLLIRSPGYFTKRIESFVNIDGCILCMDGVSEIGPGVSDNLAYGNEVGTLLANIELKPLRLDSAIRLNNIYYDYNKSAIRPDAAFELDKVVELLRVNPSIVVELGSHTDSRGNWQYNRELSQARAQEAIDYIEMKGIPKQRLSARGYGEDKIVNVCIDEVQCSEAEHAKNRRTELKITGFTNDPFEGKPLAEIIAEEQIDALLASVLMGEQVRIPDDAPSLASLDGEVPVNKPKSTTVTTADANQQLDAMKGDLTKSKPTIDANSPEATAAELDSPEMIDNMSASSEIGREPVRSPSEAKPQINSPVPVIIPEQSLTNVTPLTMPTGTKFSGYRVLVFQSGTSLADSNGELFFKYGTLREDKLADGSFGYMSGAFNSEPEARSYLRDVSRLFPDVRLLRYVNGFIIDNTQ